MDMSKIDISKPKRCYYDINNELEHCPECNLELIIQNTSIVLNALSKSDAAEFVTNVNGSRFCEKCPVVVFDKSKLEYAAKSGLYNTENLSFSVSGIVDLEAVPKNKRDKELGTDDNPLPLVAFLPKKTISSIKIGRNDPCHCGSGKKFKKCCLN
jgi:uncharacterized protein YecA (UPF0149 family)